MRPWLAWFGRGSGGSACSRANRVYLGHIGEAINDIEEYTAAGRDAFLAERMRQDAVIRKLEIIGEAVKQLSSLTIRTQMVCRRETPRT